MKNEGRVVVFLSVSHFGCSVFMRMDERARSFCLSPVKTITILRLKFNCIFAYYGTEGLIINVDGLMDFYGYVYW